MGLVRCVIHSGRWNDVKLVIPAYVGIEVLLCRDYGRRAWTPAFAGVTLSVGLQREFARRVGAVGEAEDGATRVAG